MTKDELRVALRDYRLEEGLSYDELYARCRRRRVSRSALHRFMSGHPISETGAHALHRFWLSVLDRKDDQQSLIVALTARVTALEIGTAGDQPTAP